MFGLTLAAGLLTTGVATANAAPEFRGHEPFRGGAVAGRDFHADRGFRDDRFRDDRFRDDRFRGGVAYRGGYGFAGGVDINYIPPCPGPGYVWTAGYWNGGVWVPGVWVLRGGPAFVGGFGYGRVYDRGFVAERRFDRGYERGFDRARVEGGRGFERGRR
jgi:hypothetical protein